MKIYMKGNEIKQYFKLNTYPNLLTLIRFNGKFYYKSNLDNKIKKTRCNLKLNKRELIKHICKIKRSLKRDKIKKYLEKSKG